MEESEGSFPFLNVEMVINGETVDTWIFRKKTHTGVMLNFSAIVPNSWKLGLIRGFINTAKMVCSTEDLFNQEILKLRDLFSANGYPKAFFDKALEKCLSIFEGVTQSQVENTQEERKYILGIPYVGNVSREYTKKIKALVKEGLDVDISTYYSSFKISQYFSLKIQDSFCSESKCRI